ncbi:MAG: hypothetical protein N3A66_09275, partial [Planctomycetota bacterium]|nr:hypothetical protein [Planctomycetota bacterium]
PLAEAMAQPDLATAFAFLRYAIFPPARNLRRMFGWSGEPIALLHARRLLRLIGRSRAQTTS